MRISSCQQAPPLHAKLKDMPGQQNAKAKTSSQSSSDIQSSTVSKCVMLFGLPGACVLSNFVHLVTSGQQPGQESFTCLPSTDRCGMNPSDAVQRAARLPEEKPAASKSCSLTMQNKAMKQSVSSRTCKHHSSFAMFGCSFAREAPCAPVQGIKLRCVVKQ